ncbi:MAG: acylphosphatase [Candidatus Bathyarchaeia archaeon]
MPRSGDFEGLVRNEPDGSITVLAQDSEGHLQEFLAQIKTPPPPIAIRRLEETPTQPDPNLRYFQGAYGPLAEEPQEGFGAMQAEFRDYRTEFKGFIGEFRDYR